MHSDASDPDPSNADELPQESTSAGAGGSPESTTPEDPDASSGRDLAQVLPSTEDVLRKFAALGAQQAFQIDSKILQKFQVPDLDLSALFKVSDWDISKRLSSDLLESVTASLNLSKLEIPSSFWDSVGITNWLLRDSTSVDSLYSLAQLAVGTGAKPSTVPRMSRTPEAFFNEHIVEVRDVPSLLKALGAVQTKQHRHRPVWRGQQDATWAVHSSLHRRMEKNATVDEDRLVSAEISALDIARREWGMRARRPVEFFANLQHHGAPTRLLDATVDPEVATWFAVEADPELNDVDGLVLGWGRSPIMKSGVPEVIESVPDIKNVPFWHAWTDREQRRRVDWGTGTKTWTWFPPALNDRMRAQRAGFLLEAGPILTSDVVKVFSRALSQDWRASEIARATSIVGLPARHDVLTKPNDANLVPLFAFRIKSSAKSEIRRYLERKGLTYSGVYPDLGGLVQRLRGPYGISETSWAADPSNAADTL